MSTSAPKPPEKTTVDDYGRKPLYGHELDALLMELRMARAEVGRLRQENYRLREAIMHEPRKTQ